MVPSITTSIIPILWIVVILILRTMMATLPVPWIMVKLIPRIAISIAMVIIATVAVRSSLPQWTLAPWTPSSLRRGPWRCGRCREGR